MAALKPFRLWSRCLAGGAIAACFVAAMSLMGGCGSLATTPESDFYIAHLQDPNAIWFRAAPQNPVALSIAALPVGTVVSDLQVLRFTGTSDWLYLVLPNKSSLLVLEKVGSGFQSVATVPVGSSPLWLDIDGLVNFAYVSNFGGDSVTVVDLISYQAAATISLPAGSQPRQIRVTPDGKKVYVVNQGTGTVTVIDAVARTVIGSITVGSQPSRLAMAPDGHEVYVSNTGSGTVSVIDVLTDTVSATIPGLTKTNAVALNATGSALWAGQGPVGGPGGSVSRYDTSTLTSSVAPFAMTGTPTYLLTYVGDSFLAVDQSHFSVGQYSVTNNGNSYSAKDLSVGTAPAAVAVVRVANRNPSRPNQPQCKLIVTTAGSGTVAVSPTSVDGNYVCGTTVTLTAAPGTGQQFTQWTGDLSGNTNPATLKVDVSKNVTATFLPVQNVVTTVQANNPFVIGLYITADGTSWAGHDQYSAPAGSTHTHSTTSPQIVQSTQYTFQNWTPSPAPNLPTSLSQIVTLGATNTAYTANFTKTGYVVSTYGCPVTVTSPQVALSSNPLVYPLNAPITVNGSLSSIEVFQNGSWTTFTSFPVNLTLNGPISIWAPCAIQKSATCVAPPSGLAAWWNFDPAGSGSVADLSGHTNTGALVNGVLQAGGKVAGYLSSGTTYFQAPSSSSLNFGTGPFSADMWVRWSDPTANNSDTWLISKYGVVSGSGHGFDLALTRGSESPGLARLMVRVSDGTVNSASAEWDTIPPAVPADGIWHLVAFSYDPSKLLDNRVAFYVDGVQVLTGPFNVQNTQNLSQTVVLDVSNSAPLEVGIGGNPPIPILAFNGGIDEVEVFNRVITAADLQPLMAADALGKCKPSAPANVTLTIATNPSGLQARIGTSAAYAATPISEQVPANQTQTISVTDPQFVSAAGTGHSFTGWSTGGSTATTTVQPSSNFTATANFKIACSALTVTVSPAGSGAVVASPASGGLSGLPANCYAPGTTVTLTASGNSAQDYTFSGSWSGAGSGSNTRTVVMNGPSAVTANFNLYPAPNLNFGGANWGYASGSTYQITGKVGNGGADYNNIKITQAAWTAAAGTGTITDTTALPITIGALTGGAIGSSIILNATMPTTVTQFKVCVSGTAVSPLSGNTVAWADNQNCNHVFPRN